MGIIRARPVSFFLGRYRCFWFFIADVQCQYFCITQAISILPDEAAVLCNCICQWFSNFFHCNTFGNVCWTCDTSNMNVLKTHIKVLFIVGTTRNMHHLMWCVGFLIALFSQILEFVNLPPAYLPLYVYS